MTVFRTVQAASVVFALCTAAAAEPANGQAIRSRRPAGRRQSPAKTARPAPLPCGDLLGFQVLLDRQGFSPGEIDNKTGDNLTHALAALQAAREIATSGQPDCDTWHALGGDEAGSLITTYTVTEEDAKGPFVVIPAKIEQQAALPALGYRSLLEKLGERFHAAPALIQWLNRGVRVAAGRSIHVPAIEPFDPDRKPAPDAEAGSVTIQVSRDESALRATRADGTLAFFAPVSSGSEHDPLPLGDWKVTSVNWHPRFHYNPDLFWDAEPAQSRATLRPGPNNPVGVVWIGINVEHYGMHGTPEPGHVGHTESHGCVRLTNWDAARLASLVKPGTSVIFQ
ncbi:MAG TPA: L,D-transpeptidase [Vicinamibacterales bacterium]|jgi:lipoprotein-anchoring transpeptidase ErfK/SrfK|nr:L,D-transpeptidase [Vicinamibacterales bacterium]